MKTIQVGQKSFIAFIKAFVNSSNVVDFYQRYSDVENIPIVLWEQTQRNKIFKISLRSNEIERLHKTYLFFKNDCEPNIHKVSIIRFDEFMINVPIKPSYMLMKRLNESFLYCDSLRGGTTHPSLKEFIIIDELLLFDEKHINIYCFSERTKDNIIKMINKNTVKWFKPSEDRLLKEIRQTPRKTKTEWEEEQEENRTNNYNKNWEDPTVIEDYLPCDTTEDNIRHKELKRLI